MAKFIEMENRMEAARGWGKGEGGSYCLMDTEFQFCKIKRFLVMVAHMSVFNATEPYT